MNSKDNGLEHDFRKSLRRLPGYSKRLYDNGPWPTDETMLADFILTCRKGNFAFECKSTGGPSVAFRDFKCKGSGIHAEQLRELVAFEDAREDNVSYLALRYERTGNLYLVRTEPARAFFREKKSINEKEASDMGWRQKPHPDGGWFLRV
jgi:hypothetical protein